MQLQRKRPEDIKNERAIVTAMIVSTEAISKIRRIYQKIFFQSKLCQTVSQWAVDFYDIFDAPPQHHIKETFEKQTKDGKLDPDLTDQIEKFLKSISDEYETFTDFDAKFWAAQAEDYFEKRNYILYADAIKEAINQDDMEMAKNKLNGFSHINVNMPLGKDTDDPAVINEALPNEGEEPEILFTLPGALGKMMGPIEKQTFLGFLGREKIGKTFTLMMLAMAARRCGVNVAFLEVGDMTNRQIATRIGSYYTKKAARERNAGHKRIPILDCLRNQMGTCEQAGEAVIKHDDDGTKYIVDVFNEDELDDHEICIDCWKDRNKRHTYFKGSVWWKYEDISVWTKSEVRKKSKWYNRKGFGKIIREEFPMDTVSALYIRDWLIYQHDVLGRKFGLVCVDYADILAPNDQKEFRHQENDKWKTLRRISQEFDNCIATVTQSDAGGYNKSNLTLTNFSEDKRKYGHVTHMFAINKTDYEETHGCIRYAKLLIREDAILQGQQCTVLQALSKGRPYVSSFMGKMPKFEIPKKK